MDKKVIKRIKLISIILLSTSILLVLLNTIGFLWFLNDETIKVFEKFEIDISYYKSEQTIFYIVNYVFYIALFITSILTYKLKNYGRLGLNSVLILSILYFFIAPLVFNSELPYPQYLEGGKISMNLTPGSNQSLNIDMVVYLLALIKSIVLIFFIVFFLKSKVIKVFVDG